MARDFDKLSSWLSNETVNSIAFNAGSTLGPPRELRVLEIQPDLSAGIGSLPLNGSRFPALDTQLLNDLKLPTFFPSAVSFPHLTGHLRLGLPFRFEVGARWANVSSPMKKLTEKTTGKGRSSSAGAEVRHHILGMEGWPTVTISGMVNHVYGQYDFFNSYDDIQLVEGLVVDSVNTGSLEWNLTTYSVNLIAQATYGIWTPFVGTGVSRSKGWVRSTVNSKFQTDLIPLTSGRAEASPSGDQIRVLGGMEFNFFHFGLFATGEALTSGENRREVWVAHVGAFIPIRLFQGGPGRGLQRTARKRPSPSGFRASRQGGLSARSADDLRAAAESRAWREESRLWGSGPRKAGKIPVRAPVEEGTESQSGALPEFIFLH